MDMDQSLTPADASPTMTTPERPPSHTRSTSTTSTSTSTSTSSTSTSTSPSSRSSRTSSTSTTSTTMTSSNTPTSSTASMHLPTMGTTHHSSKSQSSMTHSRSTTAPSFTRKTETKTITPHGKPRVITSVVVVPADTQSSHHTTSTGVGLTPGPQSDSGGLSKGATIAIAVVIPIIVIALLILLAIFLWRRRKQRKIEEEARRKEVEEYGYNPNNDPTLPAVIGATGSDSPEMSEDTSGYRGWGNNTGGNGTVSARKPSTNLSSGVGMAVSDDGRGLGPSGSSPGQSGLDGETLTGGAVMATGVAPRNGAAAGAGVQRGVSNASSTYSAAGRTDDSGDLLGAAGDPGYDANYSQYSSYNSQGGFGDSVAGPQPVIRDVNARRNTKIENAVYPQQGNAGISQNF